MDERTRKDILAEGAIRPETPRDREERRILEEELPGSPLHGKPLRQRLRNFRPNADAAIRALGGPTSWMRRLRAIEDAIDEHERQLEAAWRETDPADWPGVARAWDFSHVNDLIARHNRNFPAEARLPMDPRTRDFVQVNGRPYQRTPLDADWILERWPVRETADPRRPRP